jgi:hypothetical protein
VEGLPFAARLMAHGAAARFTRRRAAEVAEAIEPQSAAAAEAPLG